MKDNWWKITFAIDTFTVFEEWMWIVAPSFCLNLQRELNGGLVKKVEMWPHDSTESLLLWICLWICKEKCRDGKDNAKETPSGFQVSMCAFCLLTYIPQNPQASSAWHAARVICLSFQGFLIYRMFPFYMYASASRASWFTLWVFYFCRLVCIQVGSASKNKSMGSENHKSLGKRDIK